ncbi:hypothetical protein HZS_1740 [Henneguya salminicola]|nr:hypothetical protein HZS_1740 [Henneguya salminicola]
MLKSQQTAIAALKLVSNTHDTEITKQRDQSLRCFRFLHLFKKIMLFERTKHYNNIYASMVMNNNSDKWHHRTGRSQPFFLIQLWNPSEYFKIYIFFAQETESC